MMRMLYCVCVLVSKQAAIVSCYQSHLFDDVNESDGFFIIYLLFDNVCCLYESKSSVTQIFNTLRDFIEKKSVVKLLVL